MSWVLWRQHRAQGAVAAIALAAYAILLWITGVHMANEFHSALASCRTNGTCDELNLFSGDGAIIDLVNLSAAVPLLMGLFWGVTGIGREIDSGTHLLVWMQSVRRRDWLRGKITLLLVAAAVWGAGVTAIVTWWSGTLNSLDGNRFDPGKFDVQGIMPVAFALFGVSLGLAAGAVLRRVLPALAVTVVGFVAVRLIVVTYIRPYYQAAKVLVQPLSKDQSVPSGSWIITRDIVQNGQSVSSKLSFPAECLTPTSRQASDACLTRHGFASAVKFQPASRYWTFQWIESGVFVALAAILIAVAVIAVRRRDA
ncbi:MAG TPA: hypothetical protein VHX15_04400 [Frankiaceae bacterium]|jgi:hypothetical protein|nr:hypothetical protein [Frankiaceae bacterium]